MPVLVDLEAVSARSADRDLFARLSLVVATGDRIGVIGINGTGKSTLLRVLAGVAAPDAGVVRRGRVATVGYLPQEPELPPGRVRDALGEGWEADAALERLGLGGLATAEVATLSGGQVKRVALAAVLAQPADLLVLDEPTNHLDLPGVAWLERRLLDWRGGLVLVSHDRHLLDRLTTRMLELDRGRHHSHEGGYASYLEARAQREERAEVAEANRRNLARRELAWLRRGAPARSRKPKARIDAATRVVDARPDAPARRGELGLAIGTPRLGDKVVELSGAGYRYGEREVLRHVDLDLDPRERLGVVGPNGAGKSTLLDLIAGRRAPSGGRVEIGPTVSAGYYDQRGVDLDPAARVRDLVAGPTRVSGNPEDIALMEQFWFTGELPFAPVRTLSGGERRRLQLLLVLAARPNVLLLDEPTNDLDLDTLRMLEDFLEDWPGAVVVVSHDRTFLDRTTERIVAVNEEGTVAAVAGGLEAWISTATSPSRPSRARGARSTGASRTAADVRPGQRVADGRPSPSTVGRRLREIEKDLARLQRRRDELSAALVAAGDHMRMASIGSELTEVQAALDDAEERWLATAEEGETGGGPT